MGYWECWIQYIHAEYAVRHPRKKKRPCRLGQALVPFVVLGIHCGTYLLADKGGLYCGLIDLSSNEGLSISRSQNLIMECDLGNF